MKKFYTTLALAVAVAFSASAADLTAKSVPANKSLLKAVKTDRIELGVKTKNPAKAPAIADITGDYVLNYANQLAETEADLPQEYETTISNGSTDGTVLVAIPFKNGDNTLTMNVSATYADGTLTFTSGQVFSGATISYYHWSEDYKSLNPIETIKATWTGTGFKFDADDAIGLPVPNQAGYYYFLSDTYELTKIVDDPNADPNEGWTSIGQATFQDGWVLTLFGKDQTLAENQYKVEMQQNNADKNIYRLVNPYRGNFPLASQNQSTSKNGYIQFNITDPDHVSFDLVEAGFAFSQAGITKFYAYNGLAYYIAATGRTAAEIVQILGKEEGVLWSTFKDGVLTVPSTYDATKGYNNDACFGIQGAIDAGYSWPDEDEKPVNMEAKIIFPEGAGIDDITIDNNNAPVEYFNLQGIRIAEPTTGVVIRRQGNSVSKILVK